MVSVNSRRVLICGDRDWNDYDVVHRTLKKIKSVDVVIHGDCRGADRLGGKAAEDLGIRVLKFPADWVRG